MLYPNFNEEKSLHKKGFKCVVGLDEAGRGPLAGPVVAAAVCIKNNGDFLKGINDSKKLSEKQRENFYKILINHKDIEWGIGIVSEKVIDKINILEATKLAMKKSIKNLNPDFLILDGNFKLNINLPQKSIIKGDMKVISISSASIIAKVTRDKIMNKYNKKYPQYGFDKHKGYGTAHHIKMIKKNGACIIHRKTFRPVSEI
jgi:ribonuclease HII